MQINFTLSSRKIVFMSLAGLAAVFFATSAATAKQPNHTKEPVPENSNCYGKLVSATAKEFGGIAHAPANVSAEFGGPYASLQEMLDGFKLFCNPVADPTPEPTPTPSPEPTLPPFPDPGGGF